MTSPLPRQKRFIWLRWTNVVLRALHLVAVMLLGAVILGAPLSSSHALLAVAVSGFVMFALDVWNRPSHLRETSGIAILVKLLLIVWMLLDESLHQLLFWVIVAGSAIFAHAPARFRHSILLPPRKPRT